MQSPRIESPDFQKITDGLLGSEGPVFHTNGRDFYMVAPEVEREGKPAGQVFQIDLSTGQERLICSPSVDGYGGLPAGCQFDKKGNLWVADMRLGLLSINPDTGVYRQVCKRDFGFGTMQGCNDCVFDMHGNLWITAPGGPIAPAPYTRSMEEPFGSIYCFTCEGLMMKIDTGYKFPNGIAIQYDKSTKQAKNVIVAETATKTLWAIPVTNTEKGIVDLARKTIFGRCPGHHEGGPDGMDFDSEGNLLVANWGSGYIEVFDQFGGRPHTRIQTPFKRVSNIHFRPGSQEVYVTEHDSHGLWRFSWVAKGAKHFCEC